MADFALKRVDTLSGSHENSVMALLNGTFNAAATWWRSKDYSNPRRMEMKKMIAEGQWRIVWKSPKLPNSPWAVPTYLPEQMRIDLQNTLLNMKDKDPAAWDGLTSGKASGFRKDRFSYKTHVAAGPSWLVE